MPEMIDWKHYTTTRPFIKCPECGRDMAPGEKTPCPECIRWMESRNGAPFIPPNDVEEDMYEGGGEEDDWSEQPGRKGEPTRGSEGQK